MSLIRQSDHPHRGYGECSSDSGAEAIMPTVTLRHVLAGHPIPPDQRGHYVAPMTASANSVIAAINSRRPGLSDTKTQLLLFFCQGHHLARGGDPLFTEQIHATETGLVVDDLPDDPGLPLQHEGPLNVVGYVLSRYGNLSPADLRTLVQAGQPWQLAMKSTSGPRIEWAWLRDWFRRPDETNDPANDRPTADQLKTWRARKAG